MEENHSAQVGALPVRGTPGRHQVLLITTRESGRWVIPKGWPMKGKKDHDAAAREAYEEAGVVGKVHKRPLGAFTYDKRREDGSKPVRVMVYVLEVEDEMRRWPEREQRRRRWLDAAAAARLVEEPGLKEILSKLNALPDARIAKAG